MDSMDEARSMAEGAFASGGKEIEMISECLLFGTDPKALRRP